MRFIILDAPNKEPIEKHHGKIGIKCDWIMGVKTTQKNEIGACIFRRKNSVYDVRIDNVHMLSNA